MNENNPLPNNQPNHIDGRDMYTPTTGNTYNEEATAVAAAAAQQMQPYGQDYLYNFDASVAAQQGINPAYFQQQYLNPGNAAYNNLPVSKNNILENTVKSQSIYQLNDPLPFSTNLDMKPNVSLGYSAGFTQPSLSTSIAQQTKRLKSVSTYHRKKPIYGTEEYRRRREKNNEAVRKSRGKAKIKQAETQQTLVKLSSENEQLKMILQNERLAIKDFLQTVKPLLPHGFLEKHPMIKDMYPEDHHGMQQVSF